MNVVDLETPTHAMIGGSRKVFFGGSDYLGLSFHNDLIFALCDGLKAHGLGRGASRKTTGTTSQLLELETKLREWGKVEAAILTRSALVANLSVMETLSDNVSAWIIDDHSHATFARCLPAFHRQIFRYRHLDINDLVTRFSTCKGTVAVYTDSVFPLSGDCAPLPELIDVVSQRGHWLVTDESHSLGVLGDEGRGFLSTVGEGFPRTVVTSTLNKAFGCMGGVIMGPKALLRDIEKRATLLAATGALPPSLCAAISVALDIIRGEPQRLQQLERNAATMRLGLGQGNKARRLEVPIFALTGERASITALHDTLASEGYWLPLLEDYPGVSSAPILRWIVQSGHTSDDIDKVTSIIGGQNGK
jgi:8-amino-7-oxononanoate synthase